MKLNVACNVTYFHDVRIDEIGNIVSLPDLRNDIVFLIRVRQNVVLCGQQIS